MSENQLYLEERRRANDSLELGRLLGINLGLAVSQYASFDMLDMSRAPIEKCKSVLQDLIRSEYTHSVLQEEYDIFSVRLRLTPEARRVLQALNLIDINEISLEIIQEYLAKRYENVANACVALEELNHALNISPNVAQYLRNLASLLASLFQAFSGTTIFTYLRTHTTPAGDDVNKLNQY